MKRLAVLWLWACSCVFAQETLTIETVTADRKLWPREVTVSVPHDVPIVVNGKASGSMKAGPGRSYPVKSISASGVVLDALGAPLTFAVTDTDVLARAEQLKIRRDALAAAATPPPAPVATPSQPVSTPAAQGFLSLRASHFARSPGGSFSMA